MSASGQNAAGMSGLTSDPRVLRTRATLREALMQLLQHKDWGGISTSDICRRAGVARSSFYEHYSGKADLLDEIFAAHMGAIPLSREPGAPLGTLDWLAAHVASNPALFARSAAGSGGDSLLPRFRSALTRKLEEELNNRGHSDACANAAYIIGGSLAFLSTAPGDGTRDMLQRLAEKLLA